METESCHKEQNGISLVYLGNLSSLDKYTVFIFFVQMDSFSTADCCEFQSLLDKKYFSDFSDASCQTVFSSMLISAYSTTEVMRKFQGIKA